MLVAGPTCLQNLFYSLLQTFYVRGAFLLFVLFCLDTKSTQKVIPIAIGTLGFQLKVLILRRQLSVAMAWRLPKGG